MAKWAKKLLTALVTTGGGRADLNTLSITARAPGACALRKGDFSLRQERAPARVRSVQESGISKIEMGTVKQPRSRFETEEADS